MRPARLRAQAKRDLSDTAVYYTEQGGAKLGRAFAAAATAALEPLARMPGLGSPRAAEFCGVPELRVLSVSGWPVQWFYFERDDILDVVRLLGERQDIAMILTIEPPTAN